MFLMAGSKEINTVEAKEYNAHNDDTTVHFEVMMTTDQMNKAKQKFLRVSYTFVLTFMRRGRLVDHIGMENACSDSILFHWTWRSSKKEKEAIFKGLQECGEAKKEKKVIFKKLQEYTTAIHNQLIRNPEINSWRKVGRIPEYVIAKYALSAKTSKY
ncbi:hypothetical protein L1987_09068 [Smallanthus sonchifolius]|uniref:Uncharacterized protein n=1 Tax=Smallanthus sonchifolius TaxID=185202 RepID=A0ACB9JNY9_9ASTR|nr:hypothetical protein L1987_09068 [Smallanthus sonchifolius]